MSQPEITGPTSLDKDRLYGAETPSLPPFHPIPLDPQPRSPRFQVRLPQIRFPSVRRPQIRHSLTRSPRARLVYSRSPHGNTSHRTRSPSPLPGLFTAIVILFSAVSLSALFNGSRPGSDKAKMPSSALPAPVPPAWSTGSPTPTSAPTSTGPTTTPTPTGTSLTTAPPGASPSPTATPPARSPRPSHPSNPTSPPRTPTPTPTRSVPATKPANPATGICRFSVGFTPTGSGDYTATIVVTNTTPETVTNRQGARGINAVDQMMKDWNSTMNWPDDYEIRRENGLTIRFINATRNESGVSALVQKWLVCN